MTRTPNPKRLPSKPKSGTPLRRAFVFAATLAALAAAAPPAVRAQSAGDPLDRYQREAIEQSRRSAEPAFQEPLREPIEPPPAVLPPPVVIAPRSAPRAPGVDRRDKRAERLAVPDEYLDPTFPTDAARIAPEQSDNVQEVPLDAQVLDDAEREEAERYKEALGHYKDPDELTQDNWGQDPSDRTRANDVQEYEDPAEW